MALLDWSQRPGVESVPDKQGGAWVFRGTRTPISVVFENIENGVDHVLDWFPGITREQIYTVLEFAARSTKPAGWR